MVHVHICTHQTTQPAHSHINTRTHTPPHMCKDTINCFFAPPSTSFSCVSDPSCMSTSAVDSVGGSWLCCVCGFVSESGGSPLHHTYITLTSHISHTSAHIHEIYITHTTLFLKTLEPRERERVDSFLSANFTSSLWRVYECGWMYAHVVCSGVCVCVCGIRGVSQAHTKADKHTQIIHAHDCTCQQLCQNPHTQTRTHAHNHVHTCTHAHAHTELAWWHTQPPQPISRRCTRYKLIIQLVKQSGAHSRSSLNLCLPLSTSHSSTSLPFASLTPLFLSHTSHTQLH